MPKAISHSRYIIHPNRFYLWIAIVTIVMMFAAFTSAYIVKKGSINNWSLTALPQLFTYSTIIIVASSVMMHMAYTSFRKNNIYKYRGFILVTTLLGSLFLIMQIFAWRQWVHSGITLTSNIAGSFVYVITGAHFLHVAGGVIALLIFSAHAFTRIKSPVDSVMQNLDPDKKVGVELMATYWHFVDILWLYLFFFFQYA